LAPVPLHWQCVYYPFEEKDAQPLHATGTSQRVCFARVPGGKDGTKRTTSSAKTGGTTDENENDVGCN
jgi:hypothetical protein